MGRPDEDHHEHSAPRGDVTTALLAVTNSARNMHIGAGTATGLLFTAHFHGHQPAVAVADGTVSVRFGAESPPAEGHIMLNPDVTWAVRVRSGASELRADLTHLKLASIDVDGTFSRLTLHLPSPDRLGSLRLIGEADDTHITRPAGTAADGYDVHAESWAGEFTVAKRHDRIR